MLTFISCMLNVPYAFLLQGNKEASNHELSITNFGLNISVNKNTVDKCIYLSIPKSWQTNVIKVGG